MVGADPSKEMLLPCSGLRPVAYTKHNGATGFIEMPVCTFFLLLMQVAFLLRPPQKVNNCMCGVLDSLTKSHGDFQWS